ncbi:MAG TPA: hypothetical protein VFI18_02585 [Gaiellales bacterium]|nr:hypothetical protein [Gaiellales bacterium]
MRSLRTVTAVVGAAVCLGALAAPAWALGPSHANITFASGSTVTETATGVTASAVLVWRPGASDLAGVGCCTSDVVDDLTNSTLVEATPQARFPFTWSSDDPERFHVDSFDARGNYVGSAFTSAPSFVSNFGDPPDSDATYSGAWSAQTAASALGGSLHFSTKQGAAATFTANVRTLAWITTVGPTHGSARILVDGRQVATVSTHAATVGFRRIKFARAWWGGPDDPVHTIRIVNAGTAGHSRVDVDGFLAVTED